MEIQGAHYFTEECGSCKAVIKGESETDREGAKNDFREKMDQHMKENHNGWKAKVKVCPYCDKVMVAYSEKNYDRAASKVFFLSRSHIEKHHPEKIKKPDKKAYTKSLGGELKQLMAKYHRQLDEDEVREIVEESIKK